MSILGFRCDECGRRRSPFRRANPGAARPLCTDCNRSGVVCDVCLERRPPQELAEYYAGRVQQKRCARCTRVCRACGRKKSVRDFPGRKQVDLCDECFGRCRYCGTEAPRAEMALGFDPRGTACPQCVRRCERCRKERPRGEAFRTVEASGVDLDACDPCLTEVFSPQLRACLERIFAWAAQTSAGAEAASIDPLTAPGEDMLLGADPRGRAVWLPAEARRSHVAVLGVATAQRRELVRNLIARDMNRLLPGCVIDRHGDLCAELFEFVPEERVEDIVYVRPGEADCPPYNLFATPYDPNAIARDVVAALRHFIGEEWDPRMDSLVNYAVVTLLADRDNEPHPFADLWRIFVDADFRARIVSRCRDPWLQNFWRREYPRFPHDAALPFLQRLAWVLRPAPGSDRLFRATVNALDIDSVLNRGGILLCDLSRNQLGAEPSQIAAALLAIGLTHACAPRNGIRSGSPVFAYLDEFTDYTSGSLASVLAGAQESRLLITAVSERIDRADVFVRVQAAAGAFICMRTAEEDAGEAARMLAARVYARENGEMLLLSDLVGEVARAWLRAVEAMLRVPARSLPPALDAGRHPEVLDALERIDPDLIRTPPGGAPPYAETARVLEALQAFAYRPRDQIRIPPGFREAVWPEAAMLAEMEPGAGILRLRDPVTVERFRVAAAPDQARSADRATRIRAAQRVRAEREAGTWDLPSEEADDWD